MSTFLCGNQNALACAGIMNKVFDQIPGKVNWIGLVLDRGLRLDKYNGKGGILSSIIAYCSAEIITGISTAMPYINVVVECNKFGIYDDNDARLKSIIGHLLEPHTRSALYLSMKGKEGAINSNATDPNCQPGEHLMKNGEMSMPSLERVTKAGIASHKTDEGCEPWKHWMEKEGQYSMPSLDRGVACGIATIRADDRNVPGLYHSDTLGRDRMSMADRGAASTGIPRTGGVKSKIVVLHDRDAKQFYYSLVGPPMCDKMAELKVFGSVGTIKNNMPRLKAYASEVGAFKLKPGTYGGSYKGACGRDMPANLNLWLSVPSKIPVGANVTKLVKEAKRKRAEHEGK